ncbi:MAG: metallopeptidase [Methylibium sp.]|nr:metallopeptidase [Methylibium sp.]
MPIQSLMMKGGAWRRHALASAMLALSAGATLAQPAPPATPAAAGGGTNGPAAGAPARPPADPAALKPFDEVVKGAKVSEGLFPIWRLDEKAWIEVPVAALGKPFLFTVNFANSIGERGLYASQMGPAWLATFRRVGRQVQLMALNEKFRAVADQGSKTAIEQAFSPSLLAAGVQASAEHPTRKSILLDASLLLADIPGMSTRLEAAFRLPYALDRANSSFAASRADAQLSTLTARLHFATPRIPAPPLTPTPMPAAQLPQAVPDPRSFFLDYVYSFAALPETPMTPREADPRLGHFTESFTDLGGDMKANPRVHYVKRWRLEKKDATAALSEPVKPITFWLDKNIPLKYRPVVEEAVLEWNKAFEKIGFKNALVVKQQPDDATWDNMDAGHASVRWFVGSDVGFNIGPSRADPRSGEIIDADIGLSDAFGRGARRLRVEDLGKSSEQRLAELTGAWRGEAEVAYCDDARLSAMETEFALELLEAREELAPDSPEVEAFVRSTIKGTMMHEVGHTLGLKHNFKASTALKLEQLSDKAFTEANSIANSVMEYVPINIALKGERQGGYHRSALGPYDYWAIEYAYKPVEPGQEKAELAKIAARSVEPALVYGDDLDAGGSGIYDGMDPLVNRFDLGDKPLAYYKKRLKLSQELWERVQARKPVAGDDPLRARRSLLAGFGQLATISELTAKYVGGMHALRDLPGTTGRPAFKPVDPAQQREALQFLASGLFSSSSFKFKPEFLSALTLDYNEWERGVPVSIPAAVSRVQLVALDRLLSPGTATRLLDLPSYVEPSQRRGLISLADVYGTLQGAIWSELKTGAEVERMRRNLQREHIKRLQALLTRGSAALPADALSLLRLQATQLQAELRAAPRAGQSVETRAHLAESLSALSQALAATMLRS